MRRLTTAAHPGTGDTAAPGDEYGQVDSRDQLLRALQQLPMDGDARPSGRTPFEEELVNAMNRLANSAETPAFDAPRIERRTRRRRTAGIAAVAAALIAAGGGTALATSVASNGSSAPASSTSGPATDVAGSDATTLLYTFADGTHIRMEVGGYDLQMAKAVLEKTRTKLGGVTRKAVKNCKPGSVVGVSPHAPKAVKPGDTVDIVLCAG
ncbi:PASTA domain-containing protein [Streptomyces sp. NPDC092369]|uniref:PASTA domain-containing protein n=1 Tax=Streptomyces sp. NPDC092369 TaxID=3366015 RepID=UPI0037F424F0